MLPAVLVRQPQPAEGKAQVWNLPKCLGAQVRPAPFLGITPLFTSHIPQHLLSMKVLEEKGEERG